MKKRKDTTPCPYQYDFQASDFLDGDEPYKYLYQFKDPFLQSREATKVAMYAKSIGVGNFGKLWSEYQRSMRGVYLCQRHQLHRPAHGADLWTLGGG